MLRTDYNKKIWSLFVSGRLKPDSQLTGKFERSTVDADVANVMLIIEHARQQEEARIEWEMAAREME